MTPWDEVDLAEFPGRDVVPRTTTLAEMIEYWATHTPDALLDHLGDHRRTYAQGARDVEACARALVTAGVGPGDRVGVLTDPRPEYLTLLAALGRVGAVWVGMNPAYTATELDHVLRDSQPVLVFTASTAGAGEPGADIVSLAAAAGARETVTFDGAETAGTCTWADFLANRSPHTVLPDPPSGHSPALIVYTSGSTGTPKGAVISHRAYLDGCYLQASRYHHPSASTVAYLPVNHVAGLLDLGGVPIAMGGALHYLAPFDPGELLHLITTEQVTMWGGVPTVMQYTVAHPDWATTDFSTLRHLVWGGSPMPADLVPALRATGARLGTVYGLTESCVAFTYADADATDEELATTIGRPDPRLEYRIEGGTGPGELLLRNPCLMTEYLHQPEATAESFTHDGFLRTGDIAVERSDGLIELVGRSKEMFKSGGYNVYPREVETVLEAHPAVELVVVVDTPDPTFHQVGVAFVVPTAAHADDPHLAEALRTHCRDHLAGYKVPKRFEIVTDLPRISIGKIDRPALRRRASTT